MVGVSLYNLYTLKGGVERIITGLKSDTEVSKVFKVVKILSAKC